MFGQDKKKETSPTTEMSLQEAMELALEVVEETLGVAVAGSTQFAKEGKFVSSKSLAYGRGVDDVRELEKEYLEDMARIEPDWEMYYVTLNTELVPKYSLAQCHELASFSFGAIFKARPDLNTIIAKIKGGDHVFVITNLPEKYDLSKPETLGEAVFCDAWNAWCGLHKLSALPKELKKYDDSYIAVKNSEGDGYLFYYCKDGKATQLDFVEEKEISDQKKEIRRFPAKSSDARKKELETMLEEMKEESSRLMSPHEMKYFFNIQRKEACVYPAKDYLLHLKNYYSSSTGIENVVYYAREPDIKPDAKTMQLYPIPGDSLHIVAQYWAGNQLQTNLIKFPPYILNVSDEFRESHTKKGFQLDKEFSQNLISRCPGAVPFQRFHIIHPLTRDQSVQPSLSSRYINSGKYKQKIKDAFIIKIDLLIEATEAYIRHLSYLKTELNDNNDEIINNKITKIRKVVKDLQEAKEDCQLISVTDDYASISTNLQARMIECVQNTLNIYDFAPEDLRALSLDKKPKEILRQAQAVFKSHLEVLKQSPVKLIKQYFKNNNQYVPVHLNPLPTEIIQIIFEMRQKANNKSLDPNKKQFLNDMANRLERLDLNSSTQIKIFKNEFVYPVISPNNLDPKRKKTFEDINKFKYKQVGKFFASFSQRNSKYTETMTETRMYVHLVSDLIEKYNHLSDKKLTERSKKIGK